MRSVCLGALCVRLRRRMRAAAIAHVPGLWIHVATPDDRELGAWGEEIAARHLARSGWQLLGRRVETAAGEVDLVARDRGRLVCVEVKTARALAVPRPRGCPEAAAAGASRWRPGARCDARQLARLARAARLLAGWRQNGGESERRHSGRRRNGSPQSGRGTAAGEPRIDLIEVWLLPDARGWKLVHHRELRRPLD